MEPPPPPPPPETSTSEQAKQQQQTSTRENQQAVDVFGTDAGAAAFTLVLLLFGLLSGKKKFKASFCIGIKPKKELHMPSLSFMPEDTTRADRKVAKPKVGRRSIDCLGTSQS